LEGQRFSCASCTRCCRDLVVHLFDADKRKIDQQGWHRELETAPYVKLGAGFALNKRADGACVFLDNDGKCRIHRRFGFNAKPLACRLYPFTLTRYAERWQSGLRFDCPTAARSGGAPLGQHHAEVARIAAAVGDAVPLHAERIELHKGIEGAREEVRCVIESLEGWMQGSLGAAAELEHRLRCAAWVTEMLCRAKLTKVRGSRFAELVELLVKGAPAELEDRSAEVAASRQRKLLRQAAFAYGETSSLEEMRLGAFGKAGLIWRQLRRSRRFGRGRGPFPLRGPSDRAEATFERIEAVRPAAGEDAEPIAELVARYVRHRLQTGGVAGEGYYGWPLFAGLQALWLSVIVISWVARWNACEAGREALGFEDVVAATGYVDRGAGRAPILGTSSQRIRIRYLTSDGGIQRLLDSYPLIVF
jgi:lysine-N-methylase